MGGHCFNWQLADKKKTLPLVPLVRTPDDGIKSRSTLHFIHLELSTRVGVILTESGMFSIWLSVEWALLYLAPMAAFTAGLAVTLSELWLSAFCMSWAVSVAAVMGSAPRWRRLDLGVMLIELSGLIKKRKK